MSKKSSKFIPIIVNYWYKLYGSSAFLMGIDPLLNKSKNSNDFTPQSQNT